ncbi:MAG: hypothetical protein M1132_02495 [Chloroflexi bacterium]|nr:hypothetical protein [Chloroflexota bacterium]
MRLQEFQVSLVNKTRGQLPRSLRDFDVRSFFTLVKLFYKNRRIHYEVWVRGKERLIEVGLHFEADRETNQELLEFFGERALEIHAELGPRIDIEQWTNSWGRVHEVVPYASLDSQLVDELSTKLANLISVLQPMLNDFERRKLKRTQRRDR